MPRSEQGIRFDRYTVIPRCLVFIRNGDQVLMLKGAPTKRIWANKYNGIGGHIERSEDPLSAARRELREEANLDCELRLCAVGMVDADERIGISMYVFVGEYQGGEIKASGEGALEWLRIDELSRYPLVEDLYVVIPRLLEMKPGDHPLSMLYYYDTADRLQVRFG